MRNDARQDGDDGDGLGMRAATVGVAAWRRPGPYGRLGLGAALSWPAAVLARGLGLLPHWHPVSLTFGMLLSALPGCVLAAVRARGRRRWREGHSARLELLEAKMTDLFEMMLEATEAAGLPAPGIPAQARRLRLVTREAPGQAGGA